MDDNIFMYKKPYSYVDNDYIWISATPNEFVRQSCFYALSIGMFKSKTGYDLFREFDDNYLLIFTENGRGVVKTEEREFITYKNHAFILDCRKPHRYTTDGYWDFRWRHINGPGVKYIYDQLIDIAPNGVAVGSADEVIKYFINIQDSIMGNYGLTVNRQSFDIHALLYCILSSAQSLLNAKPVYSDVFSYIEKNFGSAITVDKLAEIAHLSKYHFTRIFKRLTGYSPYHYITNYRINHSKLLLAVSDKTVNEISLICGFSSVSNYIAQFKKQVGVTPELYRKKQLIE